MSPQPPTGVARKRPKRVCMVAYTRYSSDGRIRLEAESLVGWGYAVSLIAPREGAAPRTYELRGVSVKELRVPKYRGKNKMAYLVSYATFLVLAFLSCTAEFFRSRMDVIHVHNMPDVLVFAAIVPRLLGCKLILDVHDSVPETYGAKFGKPAGLFFNLLKLEEKICCWLAHRVIAVNHVQRQVLVARGVPERKLATVLTMQQPSSYQPVSTSPQERRSFRMVNHGTVSRRLGHDLIIRAAAKLVHEIPQFELHIVGSGEELDSIVALTNELNLASHVHFHAVVPFEELPEKLLGMDVGIVANRRNLATELMLPSKLIDYVVLGIPAIVPRLPGIQYYFSDDMVTYFDPEDVGSIVAATLRLYGDQQRRTQQAASAKRFLDTYSWNNDEMGLKNVYASLLETRAADGATCRAMDPSVIADKETSISGR